MTNFKMKKNPNDICELHMVFALNNWWNDENSM